jgi:hypothetical protein
MSYVSDRQYLLNINVPATTRTYKAIPHGHLIDVTMQSLEQAGFKVESEQYYSAIDGLVATGRYSISNVNDSEMKLQIAWQNSYNKSKSLKFAIGAYVIVCGNGLVHGDMGAFKRKHVSDVQEFTPSKIAEYITKAGDMFSMMQKEREVMKTIEISPRLRAELIGRMFIEEDFIHSTQLNIISKEIKAPTHDYNAPNTMWELYNFTTFSMKQLHPSLWMENHIDAHTWFVNESGAIVNAKSSSMVVTQDLATNNNTPIEVF